MIVFGGMIGAGKTTYAEALAKYLNSEVFYEKVEGNDILEKFYANKKRWSFALQVNFLNQRFKAIKKANIKKDSVLDRSIYEDKLFAKINYEQGNMTEEEYRIYTSLFDNMMEEIEGKPKKAPDLFIYLKIDYFDTIRERIKKRGRNYEQFDNNPELEEYMKFLFKKYDNWVFNHYNYSNILVIDADKLDITKKQDKKKFLKKFNEYYQQY